MLKIQEVTKDVNKIHSPIQTEHGRRVLSALADFQKGRTNLRRPGCNHKIEGL